MSHWTMLSDHPTLLLLGGILIGMFVMLASLTLISFTASTAFWTLLALAGASFVLLMYAIIHKVGDPLGSVAILWTLLSGTLAVIVLLRDRAKRKGHYLNLER